MNRLSNVFQGIVPAWCVLFVSTVASPLSAEKVDRELAGLKGPVESVRTEQAFFYEEYPFWREEKPVPTTIEHYNRDGCLVERVSCSPDVDAQRKQVRTFDAENRLIEVSNYDGAGNEVLVFRH